MLRLPPQIRWLSGLSWRRLALRRNLAAYPAILLAPAAQLEAAAHLLQASLDASVDELCLLLALAPRLLALPPQRLAEAVVRHPTAWQLAAHHMDRPAMMMRHAAVREAAAPLGARLCSALPLALCCRGVPMGCGAASLPCLTPAACLPGFPCLPRDAPCMVLGLLGCRRRCTCRWPRCT